MIKTIPYFEEFYSHVYWQDAFSADELDNIQNLTKTFNKRALVGNGEARMDIRRSTVGWLEPSQQNMWIYDRIQRVVGLINGKYYRFNLTGMFEQIQLTNYDSCESGNYDWHIDGLTSDIHSPLRKLSIVVQLSDPSEFEGGNLEFMPHGPNDIITARKSRGLIVAFPSFLPHRVTPVTKGTRQSLVVWINGPSFT